MTCQNITLSNSHWKYSSIVNAVTSSFSNFFVLNPFEFHILFYKLPSCLFVSSFIFYVPANLCLHQLEYIKDFLLWFFLFFMLGFWSILMKELIDFICIFMFFTISCHSSFQFAHLRFLLENWAFKNEIFHTVRDTDYLESFLLKCVIHIFKLKYLIYS